MGPIKVAVAQLAPVAFDRDRTIAKAVSTIEEAARNGARLVAFPEAFVPGYPYFALHLPPTQINPHVAALYRESVQIPSPAVDALCAAAARANCCVVMGLHERRGGTLYNSQLFIADTGAILGCRRKLVPTSHERLIWGRGDGSDLNVYPTPLGVLGGLICYEHTNALFRYALQAQGEQIHIATWPGGLPGIHDIVDAAARHYAFEAQCFVLNATAVFTDASLAALDPAVREQHAIGGGFSGVISPRGRWLAGPVLEGEALIYAELDFAAIDAVKAIVDSVGHYARPDVVQLKLNRTPQSPLDQE
jgi:predicted amidohydrolase